VGVWLELFWKPQSAALAAAHKRDQQATTDLFSAEQNLGHLKHLASSEAQLKALGDSMGAAVPQGDDLDTFILEINAMAATTGVRLSEVAPGAESGSKGGLSTIPVTIGLDGGYFQVQSFFDAVRSGQRLMVIDSFTESPAGPNAVTASINGHLFAGLVATAPTPRPVPASAPTAGKSTSTKAPSGVISGPVSRATAAVNAANANTAAVEGATH
jgi:Tfp pilus assembly protein PilO